MRLYVFACAASVLLVGPVAAQNKVQLRSLEDALRVGEAASPRLQAAEERQASSRGSRLQADALPNPELFIDAENFAGSRDYRGSQALELTAGLAQKVELGGKRRARVGAAEAGMALAAADSDAERLALREDIARSYIQALFAARLVDLESDRLKNAQALASAVKDRVENGKEPPTQLRRSEIALASAEIASQKAAHAYRGAVAGLQAALGTREFELAANSRWFDAITEPQEIGAEESALSSNPENARLRSSIARARAELAREQAEAHPDPTLRAGVRNNRENGSSAFVVGFSIPIPVFNQNRGNILRSHHEVNRAEAEAQAIRQRMAGDLAKAVQALAAAHHEAATMRGSIVPAADDALSATREGYLAGKFGFLDLLDAQRTQFEVRAQHAAALREYHLAQVELMRLTGRRY